MKKLDAAVQAHLDEMHRSYCDYNQKEPLTCVNMAATGHPRAADYLKLRAFFDSLKYACNSRARLFSYKSEQDYSEYWAPELRLSSNPTNSDLAELKAHYSADYNKYIAVVSSLGWPKEAGARLDGGSWLIHTVSEELTNAVSQLRNSTSRPAGISVNLDLSAAVPYYRIEVNLFEAMTLAINRKLQSIIREHHKGFILPKRDAEQDKKDTAALPLEEKRFSLGNVQDVTVTDRHVLVPLLPLPVDKTFLMGIVNKLVGLLEEGFPFSQAADWLQKFLEPKSFRELELKYGH
jgi:hypothetical protein